MAVAFGTVKRTRVVAWIVFQVMAGPAKVPPLTRAWDRETVLPIDTRSQEKLIGRSVGVMAVGAHNHLVFRAGIKTVRSKRILSEAIVASRCSRFPLLPMAVAVFPIDGQQVS
jgi:hypothetical protein